jgi:nicotinamidase-related amidase
LKEEAMLTRDNTVLVLIDVQGRLAEQVNGAQELFGTLQRLLAGAQVLGLPLIVTEQIPEKLGTTRAEFQPFISAPPIRKTSFSCCGEPAFVQALEASGKGTVLLCGIETHVCVWQTARDLLSAGFAVYVATDAVSSRDPANKALALRRMENARVCLTSTEMALFELLGDARDPAFKSILQIVK